MADLTVKVDVPGVETLAKATDKLIDASTAGFGQIFGRLCLPAAEELGLLFQVRISGWRKYNAARFERKIAARIDRQNMVDLRAHPRLLLLAAEHASLVNGDEVQEMWAVY